MNGHAVQIVHAKDVGFELDIQALRSILLDENVKHKKVVILSVAGAYRKGKSFLLNFFVRYLQAKGSPEWLGVPNKPLKGFSWKCGSEKHTSGILMWSEIFIVTMPNNEEVAVILLDTQGTFDCRSSVQECATIFALSTMISSVQVYNLSQIIHETDLQHLQLFSEYGRLAGENDSCQTPFQKLLFLIRDWFHGKDFGFHGGEAYLKQQLEISEHKPELQKVRSHIKKCFNDISCFLMPFPGEEVAGESSYDGRLSRIKDEFKKQVQILVAMLLSPRNLVIKEIDGKQIKVHEIVNYFQAYLAMFQGDKLPTPISWYEATVQANNQIAADTAKKQYKAEMDKVCSWDHPSMTPKQIYDEHLRLKQSATDLFRKTRKMGEAYYSGKYELILNKELDALYSDFQQSNAVKCDIEQAEMDHRREQNEIRIAINKSQKETEDVKNMLKQNEMNNIIKQNELREIIHKAQWENEAVKKMLEENLINDKIKQDELKHLLENSEKETIAIRQMMERNELNANMKKEELKQEMEKMEKSMEEVKKQMERSAQEKEEAIKNLIKQSAEEREEMIKQFKRSKNQHMTLAMNQHEELKENLKKKMEANDTEFRKEYEKLHLMATNKPSILDNIVNFGVRVLGIVLPALFR